MSIPVSEADKEHIIQLYQANVPIPDIARQYGVTAWTIGDRLNRWGIPRTGTQRRRKVNREHRSEEEVVAKYRELGQVEAVAAFYGWTTPTVNALLRRQGVPRVDEEIAARLNEKRPLILQRLSEGWSGGAISLEIGIGESTLGLWFKRNGIRLKKRTTTNTSVEKRMATLLQELGLPYTQQFPLGRKRIDFWLPHYWLLIETRGDYWHSNPRLYSEAELNKAQMDVRCRDKAKVMEIQRIGLRLLVVWESDLKADPEAVKGRILKAISLRQSEPVEN